MAQEKNAPDSGPSNPLEAIAAIIKLLLKAIKKLFGLDKDGGPSMSAGGGGGSGLDSNETKAMNSLSNIFQEKNLGAMDVGKVFDDARDKAHDVLTGAKKGENLSGDDYKKLADNFIRSGVETAQLMNFGKEPDIKQLWGYKKDMDLQQDIAKLRADGKFDNNEFAKALDSELQGKLGLSKEESLQAMQDLSTLSGVANRELNNFSNAGMPFSDAITSYKNAAIQNSSNFKDTVSSYVAEQSADLPALGKDGGTVPNSGQGDIAQFKPGSAITTSFDATQGSALKLADLAEITMVAKNKEGNSSDNTSTASNKDEPSSHSSSGPKMR